MKKLEDGTEYLFRTEERDKDGNLIKSVRYAKDGKTVERVREFKMAPAGVTDPARNVVASEIRYGKNGEVIYKRAANADFSGFDVERFLEDEQNIWGKVTYVTHLDGNRFRSKAVSGVAVDYKTGKKLQEVEFMPDNDSELKLVRKFDNKTGTKVVQEVEVLSDDMYEVRQFGQGKSKIVSRFSGAPDGENQELLEMSRFDSQGRLRKSFFKDEKTGNTVTTTIDKKGRKLVKEFDGEEDIVSQVFTKKGKIYQQYYLKNYDGFNIFCDGKQVGTVRHPISPNVVSIEDANGKSSRLIYDENGKKQVKFIVDNTLGGKTSVEYYPNGNPKERTVKFGGETTRTYFDEKDSRKRITVKRGKDGRIYEVSRPPLPNREGKTISYRGHNVWYPTEPGQKLVEHYNYGGIGRAPITAEIYDNGKLIRAGNSTFEYLNDGKIVEENLRENFKIIYQGDFDHPIERFTRLYESGRGYFWEKMPLEF